MTANKLADVVGTGAATGVGVATGSCNLEKGFEKFLLVDFLG